MLRNNSFKTWIVFYTVTMKYVSDMIAIRNYCQDKHVEIVMGYHLISHKQPESIAELVPEFISVHLIH